MKAPLSRDFDTFVKPCEAGAVTGGRRRCPDPASSVGSMAAVRSRGVQAAPGSAKTPEPFGNRRRRRRPIFVVQRHDARRLHYDLRLERDGVLASWAVPKGMPLERGERHLAVHVEDHPLDYATFEGTIPAGEYGAGTVEIWDSGTYELVEEKKDGGLTVQLHGKRLEGSGHSCPRTWTATRRTGCSCARTTASDDTAAAGYAPMLATLADDAARGRRLGCTSRNGTAIARSRSSHGGEATLVSRNANDLTARFPTVARAIAHAVRSPNVRARRRDLRARRDGPPELLAAPAGSGTLVYFAFDVLELDGEPLSSARSSSGGPAREVVDRGTRRRRLHVVRRRRRAARRGRGAGARRRRREARFVALPAGKRSRDWLQGEDARAVRSSSSPGTRAAQGAGHGSASLVLAVTTADGCAGPGTSAPASPSEIDRLLEQLRPLERETSPFAEVPKMPRVRREDVVWVEPALVAEVQFAEWTHEGRLRAPVYLGLRDDKAPAEVRRERPVVPTEIRRGKTGAHALQSRQAVLAGGGDHQGRLARVLPRRRARPRPASARAALHDEALPGRLAGQELLPEGRAEAPAAVDAHGAVPATTRERRDPHDRVRARRTTSSRCSGW